MPIDRYHKGPPRWWSKTSLRNFKECGPKWTGLYLRDEVYKKRPDGAIQGMALDCWLTEGAEEFSRQFAIKPQGMSLTTKEGKAWKEAHDGREILSHDDGLILTDAIDAVRTCSLAQHTVRRDQPALGIGLQARPDWINHGAGMLFDLKKTRDLESFGKQAIDLGYHLQAALAGWCLVPDSIYIEHSYLVAVEWERGARCRVLEIPHEYLDSGHREMVALAQEVADRVARDDWTDKQDNPGILSAPSFMERKMEAIP
jgi:hypothetical protein